MAWDALREGAPLRANRHYLAILQLAAWEGEARVDDALRSLLEQGEIGEGKLNADAVSAVLRQETSVPPATDIVVAEVALASLDELLGAGGSTGVVQ